METLILALLKGFALPAFYAVIRRLWPAKATAQYPAEELAEISSRYRRHEYVSIALFLLLFWPVAGVICTYLLILLQRWHDSQMPSCLLLIRLQPIWLNWLLPGEFLGLIVGGWALIFCMRWYYGENESRRITAAANHKAGFDGTKVFGWLGAFVVGLATTWTILDLDWYTRFEDDKIVVNSLFSFQETTYPYGRVADLVESTQLIAPNGKLVTRTRQFVLFDDGEKWCHDGLLRDPTPLIDLLKAKTGRQFRTVQFIEDADRKAN